MFKKEEGKPHFGDPKKAEFILLLFD